MSASIKAKIRQSCNKQQNNKTTKQQTTIFLPEINKVFLRPKWSSRRAESDATKQTILSLQEVGQNCKIVVKIEFTPLSLDRKIFPFNKKGFF